MTDTMECPKRLPAGAYIWLAVSVAGYLLTTLAIFLLSRLAWTVIKAVL